MQPARPASFGRRGQPLPPPPTPAAEARSNAAFPPADLDPPIGELSQRLRASFPRAPDEHNAARPHIVPRSFMAALLAGIATACVAAAFTIAHQSSQTNAAVQVASVAHLAGIDGKLATPALLFLSLLGAGRATAGTLLTAHFVLRRINAISLPAYVLGGAAAGAFWVVIGPYLGGGGHDLVQQAAMGACAGFFYRLLAGSRPA